MLEGESLAFFLGPICPMGFLCVCSVLSGAELQLFGAPYMCQMRLSY